MRPVGGAWWPGPHFRQIVQAHGLTGLPWAALPEALDHGMAYLDARYHERAEDDERAQFREYYAIVLRALGMEVPAALVAALADAAVDRLEINAFHDTHKGLARLRALRLGVFSNAWPSLERK